MNEATPHARSVPPTLREISLPGLVQTTWRGLWLLGAVAVLCVLVTAGVLKLHEPVYTAAMIVAPAQTDLSAASQLASEIEEFASLATLAQTPAKIERVSDLERYAQLFGSRALAARLEAEHHLLRTVFVDQWDPEHQSWHPPTGVLAKLERVVLHFFGYPGWTEPNDGVLAEWLGKHIEVTRLGNSSLFRLEVSSPTRTFAVSLVDMAHRAADEMLRQAALERVGGQIAQLESDLAKATAPTRKQALEAALADQYQAQALLEAGQPYAAQVVVPAAASTMPSSLNPILALALAAVVGMILGLFVVFLRDALRGAAR